MNSKKLLCRLKRYTFLELLLLLVLAAGIFSNYLQKFFRYITTHIPLSVAGANTSDIFGGDSIQIFYLSWKLQNNLFDSAYSIFSDPYNFASPHSVFYDAHVGIHFLVTGLFMKAFGPILGYNLGYFLLPLILCLITAYCWLSYVTENRIWRFVFALAINIIPYRLYQLSGGHGESHVFYLVPLFWYFVYRKQVEPHKYPRSDLWAGIILFLTMVSAEHQGYYIILASMIVFPIWGLQDYLAKPGFTSLSQFFGRFKWLIAGLGATVIYGYFLIQLINQDGARNASRPFGEIAHFSTALPGHINNGDFLPRIVLTIFVSFFLLIAVDIVLTRRNLRPKRPLWLHPIVAFICTLPFLSALMVGLGSHWSQNSGVYKFVWRYVPYFDHQRVPSKLLLCVFLFSVVVFSQIWQLWKERISILAGRWQRPLASALLVIFMLVAYYDLRTLRRQAARISDIAMEKLDYDWPILDTIAKQTSLDDILHVVPRSLEASRRATFTQYMAVRTSRRFLGGYHNSPPLWFQTTGEGMSGYELGDIDYRAAHATLETGATFILLDRLYFAAEKGETKLMTMRKKWSRLPYMEQLDCDMRFCLYKIHRDRIDLAKFENKGWLEDSLGGKNGMWMTKQDHINFAAAEDFRVVSVVDVEVKEDGKIAPFAEIYFKQVENMDLWILQEGAEPLVFKMPFEQKDGHDYVRFKIQKTRFALATKQAFTTPVSYKETPAEFGHFVFTIKFVEH